VKIAAVAICYKEQRFIPKYIQAMQDRVDEIVVLNSLVPWQGEVETLDNTAAIAESLGATVISYDWATEQDQRNAGQEYLADYDWIIVMDPDEFMLEEDWFDFMHFLQDADQDAYVCSEQFTYWKKGFVIHPPEDYKQIIAVRPNVRFIDKRVVDTAWGYAPVPLHHFSWARTNEETLRKISHYAHAHELDPRWYEDVWLSERTTDLHPLSPSALKEAIRVVLPPELEKLELWP